ncbi:collagen alpha-1(I) chain-like [Cervus elaphus]|uniref:collagen alpha-1(I) chain-like n=1 Tax=Cervus elaphus TaxID=9860 RepID=UPI001CC29BF0|nr:collagen alpha-1(I) chain-like [Cervus elaphus]
MLRARASWRALLIHVPALPVGTSEPLRSRPSTAGPGLCHPGRVPGPPGACPVDPSSSHAGLAAHLAVGALGPGLGAEQPRPGGQPRPRGPALPAFPVRCRPLVAICGVASVLAPLGPPLAPTQAGARPPQRATAPSGQPTRPGHRQAPTRPVPTSRSPPNPLSSPPSQGRAQFGGCRDPIDSHGVHTLGDSRPSPEAASSPGCFPGGRRAAGGPAWGSQGRGGLRPVPIWEQCGAPTRAGPGEKVRLSLQRPWDEGDPHFMDLGARPVRWPLSAQAVHSWEDRGAPASPQVTHVYSTPSWVSRADPELSAKAHPAQDPGQSWRQDLSPSAQPVCPGPPAQGRLTATDGRPGGPLSPAVTAAAAWHLLWIPLGAEASDAAQPRGACLGASGDSGELRSSHLIRRPTGAWVGWWEGGRRQSPGPAQPEAWSFLQAAPPHEGSLTTLPDPCPPNARASGGHRACRGQAKEPWGEAEGSAPHTLDHQCRGPFPPQPKLPKTGASGQSPGLPGILRPITISSAATVSPGPLGSRGSSHNGGHCLGQTPSLLSSKTAFCKLAQRAPDHQGPALSKVKPAKALPDPSLQTSPVQGSEELDRLPLGALATAGQPCRTPAHALGRAREPAGVQLQGWGSLGWGGPVLALVQRLSPPPPLSGRFAIQCHNQSVLFGGKGCGFWGSRGLRPGTHAPLMETPGLQHSSLAAQGLGPSSPTTARPPSGG